MSRQLPAIKSMFSWKVVGWAMGAHMETRLIVQALDMTIGNRKAETGHDRSWRSWLPVHRRRLVIGRRLTRTVPETSGYFFFFPGSADGSAGRSTSRSACQFR